MHALSVTSNDAELWNRRLAHISDCDRTMVHKQADGVPMRSWMDDLCRACRLGKAHGLPFPSMFECADHEGEVVNSDIIGPLQISFFDRFRYVSRLLDDYSWYLFIRLLVHRSDLAQAFYTLWSRLVEFGGGSTAPTLTRKVEQLHSDWAKEYKALKTTREDAL